MKKKLESQANRKQTKESLIMNYSRFESFEFSFRILFEKPATENNVAGVFTPINKNIDDGERGKTRFLLSLGASDCLQLNFHAGKPVSKMLSSLQRLRLLLLPFQHMSPAAIQQV
jgi:hypothetical protein